MGFVRSAFSFVKSFISPPKPAVAAPSPPPAAVAKPATTAASTNTQSAADVAAKEEEERRRRVVALNASGNRGQMTPAGGDTSAAPIARKMLLGQ